MPWIVVLGHASWRDSGGAERIEREGGGHYWTPPTTYEAGKHEVSEVVAGRAHAAGHLVFVDEPAVIDADYEGTEADRYWRRKFRDGGIQLPGAGDVAAEERVVGEEVRSAYPCPHCGFPAPSRAALARHVAFNHQAAG